jgi:3-hydroxyisobutyrate dehydrogenase-like beta-hydroxyacid dehydrogenase
MAESNFPVAPGGSQNKADPDPRSRTDFGQRQNDLNLALQGAPSLGVSLPNMAACQELYNVAVAAGGAGWGHSAMAPVLEKLADFEIGQK